MDWKILQIDRTNDDASGVINVHWYVSAMDETAGLSASSYGTTTHEPNPSGENYIPYEELTEAVVFGWVFSQINKAEIESNVQAKLGKLVTPDTVSGLPW